MKKLKPILLITIAVLIIGALLRSCTAKDEKTSISTDTLSETTELTNSDEESTEDTKYSADKLIEDVGSLWKKIVKDGDTADNSDEKSEKKISIVDFSMIDPDFKAAMDSYEAFFDEYIAFMNTCTSNPTDIALLSQMSSYMEQFEDTMTKMNAIDSSKLNAAELAYYTQVTLRIEKKLLSASY